MRKTLITLLIAGTMTQVACVSKKRYDDLVMEQQRIGEQKDSLVADVLAATQMVTEINADLASIKGLGVSPVSSADRPLAGKAEERAVILGKIREVIARLNAAEKQVTSEKKRISGMTSSMAAERKQLSDQLDAFQKTITDLRTAAQQQEALISQQKEQIQSLSARVDTVTQQATQLASEKAAVRDTLTHVVDVDNTVYYAVGTKDELIKRGILLNEGSKFLFFGSKTLQPARDLKPELFQRLDRRRDTVLTVPDPNKEYKIVTRQSPQYLAANVLPDGKVKGDLHVTSPAFWDAGKFLILVRD